MKKITTSIPGYRVYDYLLVLYPHEELKNQVLAFKKEFAEKYKASDALLTKPHLVLVKFQAYQMTQDRLLNRISTIAMGIAPFKVELNGFGSYPSHTIYANVATPDADTAGSERAKISHTINDAKQGKQTTFIENPHLVICHKLKPWQFEKGWMEYSHRHFTGRFIADNMVLLKRPEGEKEYQSVMHFEFQNLPVSTKQGNLFM